jgi:hypothetical protein
MEIWDVHKNKAHPGKQKKKYCMVVCMLLSKWHDSMELDG